VAGYGNRSVTRGSIRLAFRQPSKHSPEPDLKPLARFGAWFAILALLAVPAWGADPQSYKVRLEGAVSKEIESTLSASSDLVTLRKSAPVSPIGLILRARGDTARLKIVLDNFGYYQSAVTATIDGVALVNADLPDQLAALPKGKDANVVVSFVPGPQYHLGKITLEGDLPEAMRAQFTLRTGQPAISANIFAAGNRLLTALQDQGYAFAKVDAPIAYELPDSRELEVSFHVTTGAIVRLGAITVTGLERTHLPAVLPKLGIHADDQYSAQALERARRALLALGIFGSVEIKLATAPDAQGRVPVTFRVTERKRHPVDLHAAYSSDLGGSAGITWSDNNLFGGAEHLDLSASIINLNGSATNGVGYDTGAKLIVPDFLSPVQTLQISLNGLKQYLIAYDQTAETAAVTLNRNLSKIWNASAGFAVTEETIIQPEEEIFFPGHTTFYYTLFAIPLSLRYDSTDLTSPLLDANHGIRAALTVTPTLSLGLPNATFVITQVRASTYLDLHKLFGTGPGRTVLALRGLYGYVEGAKDAALPLDERDIALPPDQRFYAGGSDTIRGYRFQSVGPQFSDNTPVGGVAVDAGGVELRQRVGSNYGFAVFADGGRVGDNVSPLVGQYQIGVGAGIRYYTSIGAIRADIAFPVDRRSSSDDRLEVYIGLGQAF
jgi:translocation and assembly module TamA